LASKVLDTTGAIVRSTKDVAISVRLKTKMASRSLLWLSWSEEWIRSS